MEKLVRVNLCELKRTAASEKKLIHLMAFEVQFLIQNLCPRIASNWIRKNCILTSGRLKTKNFVIIDEVVNEKGKISNLWRKQIVVLLKQFGFVNFKTVLTKTFDIEFFPL